MAKININGNIIENQTHIRNEQKKFYSTLYEKKEKIHPSIDFFNNNIDKLSEIEKDKCEGQLTEYECAIALKQMKNAKSPGSDGITTEFYKIFWQDIKTYFINSINHSFTNRNLTELQKQGLITLLPKPNKDIKM